MTSPADPSRRRRRQPGRSGGSGRGTAPRTGRRSVVDPARRAAYDLLRAVDERDAYANLVLPGLLAERGIAGRDAAFATELGYGTLRGRGTYDAVLAACVDRPLDRLDPPVLDLLRLGAHQLLRMRVPDHAAVSATVGLAAAAVGAGSSRLVNAVLRRVAARDLDSWLQEVAPDRAEDPVGHLAVVHSHPRWIVRALLESRGGAGSDLEPLLVADNEPPTVTLAVRPGRAEVAELVAAGAEPARWSPYGAYLPSGDPAAVPAVAEGRAGVQDEGSQLVALALAAAPLDGPDRRWLDTCAGPGGKAALLAGLAAERGAHLLAAEVQPHRAELVRRALGPALDGVAEVVVADATDPPWPLGEWDRVLVDAPCTGLGALRRRPEARWRRQPADLAGLGALQRDVLGRAVDAARPGGLVGYVTCSPHVAETHSVVTDLLARRDDLEQLDARPLLPGVPDLGDGPHVQLWPDRHGTDGMFLALLRRTR